jgi:hypothetical protein
MGRAAWNQFYTISEAADIDTRYEYKVSVYVMEQFTFEAYVAGPTILALRLLLLTSLYGAIYKPKMVSFTPGMHLILSQHERGAGSG